MKHLEKQMICDMRDTDDAERLLTALETVTHSTLAAWAENLSAPRMLALLNATASDDDPEGDIELIERVLTQADSEASFAPSQPNVGTTVEPHTHPTPSRSLLHRCLDAGPS